ncbi:MAG: hypothetical protein QM497_06100 [Sulfurimonas sp.]
MPEEHIKYYLKTIEYLKNKNYPKEYDKIIKTLLLTIDISLHGAGGRFHSPSNILIEINTELLMELLQELKMFEYMHVLNELIAENAEKCR